MAAANSFHAIMEAAEALIQEKGCRQTTLQDIIKRTGLSKGAIYHYVSSKDELFGLVLKSRVEQVNAKFAEAVDDPAKSGLDHPLQLIAEGMARSAGPHDATNQIFLYLLSQMDNPQVKEIVQEVYRYTLQTCTRWVEVGKLHGAIPAEVDAAQTSEMLVMFTYGLRVQNTIRQEPSRFTVRDLAAFMARTLR